MQLFNRFDICVFGKQFDAVYIGYCVMKHIKFAFFEISLLIILLVSMHIKTV